MHEEIIDDVRDNVDAILLREALNEILSTLTEREAKVLMARFYDVKTLRQIGKEWGVNGERIRQIQSKAIRKLRHPARKPLFKRCAPLWLEIVLELREIEDKKWKDGEADRLIQSQLLYEERCKKIAEQTRIRLEQTVNAPHAELCPPNVILEFTTEGKPYLATLWLGGYFNRNMDTDTYCCQPSQVR